MKEQIFGCIYEALDEENSDRVERQLSTIDKSPATPIFGGDSEFDSLGLINFIVAVEESVERTFDVAVVLSDDESLSRDPSPFDTVATLADYIGGLLKGAGKGG